MSNNRNNVNQTSEEYNETTLNNVGADISLGLDDSAIIEIEDPELRKLIESDGFVLDDYLVVSEKEASDNLQENLPLKDNSQAVRDNNTIGLLEISFIQSDNDSHDISADGTVNFVNLENELGEGSPKEGGTQERPKKGRKRKFENQTREDKKKRVNTNLDYITTKRDVKYAKEFRDYLCNCRLKCNEKLTTNERKTIFDNFYKSGSYEARCLLLQAMIKEVPIKRKRVKHSDKKSTSREYFLGNEKVCKNIFMQTLRVSSCSVNVALKKKKEGSVGDGRGKAGGHNKLSELKINTVVQHISKFPRYISHYCRSKTEAEYLLPDTTLPLMYKLYCDETENPVSQTLYKKIFYSKFNLKRKPLKKDTCNVCDTLVNQKQNETTVALRDEAEKKHKAHLELAEFARNKMKEQFEGAKTDDTTECLSFDLEKTLPLPRIPTNIVFYKRQLWFYNCGIHNSINKGYCYTWVEGEAGRGAQEIGSCLRKHILENVSQGTRHLLLWFDSCAGQNRNIKIVLILKAVLEEHPTLQTVTHHFLEPGHSFLKND